MSKRFEKVGFIDMLFLLHIAEMCGFAWFLKQYWTIAPTALACVYVL